MISNGLYSSRLGLQARNFRVRGWNGLIYQPGNENGKRIKYSSIVPVLISKVRRLRSFRA